MRFVRADSPEALLSPILVRPVREQLEHDRLIRLLQAQRAKRKIEVGINPGSEQNVGVGSAAHREFPDLVIVSTDKGRKVLAVAEVETGESINHLEAMAQWAHYGKLRTPFHLYVPAASADVARRLCADHGISVDEFWAYHHVGEQVRFTLVQKSEHARTPRESRSKSTASTPRPRSRKAPAKLAARQSAHGTRKNSAKKSKHPSARSAKAPAHKRSAAKKTATKKAAPKKKIARSK
jgi:hypothetical protein